VQWPPYLGRLEFAGNNLGEMAETELEWVDVGFSILYMLEAFIKMMALGCNRYFMDNWNRFDFFLVIMSVVGKVTDYLGEGIMPLPPAVARILRIFRLVFRLIRVLGRCVRLFRFAFKRSEAKNYGIRKNVESSKAHQRMMELMAAKEDQKETATLSDVEREVVKKDELVRLLEDLRGEQASIDEQNQLMDDAEADLKSLQKCISGFAFGCVLGGLLGIGCGMALWLVALEWK